MGAVLSSGLAKLSELDTVLSLEDLYLLFEIVIVDSQNRAIANAQDTD